MVDRNAAIAGIGCFWRICGGGRLVLASCAQNQKWAIRLKCRGKSCTGHVSGCRQMKYANEVVLSLGSAVDTFGQKSASPGRTMDALSPADDGPLSLQPLDNLIFTK